MAAANKTKYIVYDTDAAEWDQFEKLEDLKGHLSGKAYEWDMKGDGTDTQSMELVIIKVPPNSKAKEIRLTLKVEHKWEVTNEDVTG